MIRTRLLEMLLRENRDPNTIMCDFVDDLIRADGVANNYPQQQLKLNDKSYGATLNECLQSLQSSSSNCNSFLIKNSYNKILEITKSNRGFNSVVRDESYYTAEKALNKFVVTSNNLKYRDIKSVIDRIKSYIIGQNGTPGLSDIPVTNISSNSSIKGVYEFFARIAGDSDNASIQNNIVKRSTIYDWFSKPLKMISVCCITDVNSNSYYNRSRSSNYQKAEAKHPYVDAVAQGFEKNLVNGVYNGKMQNNFHESILALRSPLFERVARTGSFFYGYNIDKFFEIAGLSSNKDDALKLVKITSKGPDFDSLIKSIFNIPESVNAKYDGNFAQAIADAKGVSDEIADAADLYQDTDEFDDEFNISDADRKKSKAKLAKIGGDKTRHAYLTKESALAGCYIMQKCAPLVYGSFWRNHIHPKRRAELLGPGMRTELLDSFIEWLDEAFKHLYEGRWLYSKTEAGGPRHGEPILNSFDIVEGCRAAGVKINKDGTFTATPEANNNLINNFCSRFRKRMLEVQNNWNKYLTANREVGGESLEYENGDPNIGGWKDGSGELNGAIHFDAHSDDYSAIDRIVDQVNDIFSDLAYEYSYVAVPTRSGKPSPESRPSDFWIWAKYRAEMGSPAKINELEQQLSRYGLKQGVIKAAIYRADDALRKCGMTKAHLKLFIKRRGLRALFDEVKNAKETALSYYQDLQNKKQEDTHAFPKSLPGINSDSKVDASETFNLVKGLLPTFPASMKY